MGFGVIGLALCGIIIKKYWRKHQDWIIKEEKRKRLETTRKYVVFFFLLKLIVPQNVHKYWDAFHLGIH